MRDLFPTFYRPTDDELKALWQDCTFVFDTNVLLNLYRYPKEAKEDFLKLLQNIEGRIWIPYQVALEFQENRLAVIAEQIVGFGKVKKILTDTQDNLRSGLEKLQLAKRHSSIDPDRLLINIGGVIQAFEKELTELEKGQPDVFDIDEIRDALDTLFTGKVGAPPANQGVLDEIYKEGKTRYQLKRPPGYLDAGEKKEEEAYIHEGLVFRRLYGDLILWYELIDAAKDDPRFKKLIFVCDDQKDDWWLTVESQGRKTIGPRPELIEEISSKSGVTAFHMYKPERFLEYAKANLGAEVKPESIQQVRDVASVNDFRPTLNLTKPIDFAEEAVLDWIMTQPETHQVDGTSNDLLVTDTRGNKTLYLILPIRLRLSMGQKIKEVEDNLRSVIERSKVDSFALIIVFNTAISAQHADGDLRRLAADRPRRTRYVVGYVDTETDPMFVPVGTI